MELEPLLEIKNLITQFQTEDERITAVNGVSFTVHKGETIGIVGESGSGKSVTALSVMRLHQQKGGVKMNGSISYHSKSGEVVDLLGLSESEMQPYRGNELGMIFQEPMTSLNPVFTCGAQVMESLMLHRKMNRKQARQRTLELFHEVDLPRPEALLDAYPHQISGGQKQRVMIAMAMCCEPSLLIADEPTTALDVTVQKRILKLMNDLQRAHNMGIIFITHDLGVVAELADRVLVMYNGRIVEAGNVMDIFSNPQHPYTKGLLACRPPLSDRLRKLPTVSDFMRANEQGMIEETHHSVEEAVAKLRITPEERTSKLEKLYANKPILEVRNLKTWFPLRRNWLGKVTDFVKAVDDVSFEVYPGETLGLVGESGCGKTTLGRTILRLLDPTDGQISFENRDITKLSQRELRKLRKDIQIIFQDPYSSLNPRITIGEAIIEPMRVHGILKNDTERKEKVLRLLRQVNMNEHHFYRYPHEFSGGQRQRICIARALGLEPKFIICDESVSALDVSVQAQVLNLLNQLKSEYKFTVIFISHDLSVTKFMSDRMIVMNRGKVEEIGDADDIYAHPNTPYTKKLINSIPCGAIKDIQEAMDSKRKWRTEASA